MLQCFIALRSYIYNHTEDERECSQKTVAYVVTIIFICISLFGLCFGINGLVNDYNTDGSIVAISVCSIGLVLLVSLLIFMCCKADEKDPYQHL